MSNPVTPIRAGTKASPEAVFAACDKLRAEKGEIRNEDVLAITGGGLGTVGRLVKMYRAHEKIIAANDALDAEVTVSLVQALDRLLKQQINRSQAAVEDFMHGAGMELTDLSETLEDRERALGEARKESEQLRDQLRERETENTRLKANLEDKQRELAETRSKLDLAGEELKSVQASHAAKLEQVASHHQHELTLALEAQRKAMEQEKREALEQQEKTLRQQHERTLAEADTARAKVQASADRLQEELAAVRDREHTVALQLKEAQAENRAHQAQLARQEAIIEENRDALAGAQQAQRDLVDAVKQQLAANTDDVETRLRSLVTATDSVTGALADVQQLLSEIQKSMADKPRSPD